MDATYNISAEPGRALGSEYLQFLCKLLRNKTSSPLIGTEIEMQADSKALDTAEMKIPENSEGDLWEVLSVGSPPQSSVLEDSGRTLLSLFEKHAGTKVARQHLLSH
jgi:hypothetical protein